MPEPAEAAQRVFAAVTAQVHPWGPSEEARTQLESVVAALTEGERVELFIDAYDQMPRLRDIGDTQHGSLLYAAAGIAGRQKPALSEAQLIHVLRSARHDCGHGLDTRLPFDFAMGRLRDEGWSAALGRAIQAYSAGLPTGGTVVQAIRRSPTYCSSSTPISASSRGPRERGGSTE